MTEPLKEQLSACLDAQLPDAELDLFVKRVARDTELRQVLGRYALASEVLRGQGAVRISAGFADRVAAAVAAEAIAAQSKPRIHPVLVSWLRPAAGAAVAAGVAAIAIFSLQPTPEPIGQQVATAQGVPRGNSQSASATENSSDSYIVPATTATGFVPATRLTNYVVAHSEFSSPLGRRTVLSGMLGEEDGADDVAPATDDPVRDTADGTVAPAQDLPVSQRP